MTYFVKASSNFFVHMSSDALPYEMDSATLADKVSDTDFMQSFTMNKRPLLVLLECGFFQRSLEEEVPPRYIPFLAKMLLRPFEETGTELLVSLCKYPRLDSLTCGAGQAENNEF